MYLGLLDQRHVADILNLHIWCSTQYPVTFPEAVSKKVQQQQRSRCGPENAEVIFHCYSPGVGISLLIN